ncbi:MAG: helix-turn-helix transcriptional regulator [Pseudomonadota bacterium]
MKINLDKIQKLMDKQGLNKTALALKMGVKESWVYEILAGRQGKTFATLEKIADALGVDPKDLLS